MKLSKKDKLIYNIPAVNYVSKTERQKVYMCRTLILIDKDDTYYVFRFNPKDNLLKLDFELIYEEQFDNSSLKDLWDKNLIVKRGKIT